MPPSLSGGEQRRVLLARMLARKAKVFVLDEPEARGTGTGGALLQAFCRLSAADPRSSGVYLETGNPDNLPF